MAIVNRNKNPSLAYSIISSHRTHIKMETFTHSACTYSVKAGAKSTRTKGDISCFPTKATESALREIEK